MANSCKAIKSSKILIYLFFILGFGTVSETLFDGLMVQRRAMGSNLRVMMLNFATLYACQQHFAM